MKYVKKPVPTRVEFAREAGELRTLEGPVRYQAGDALMTGVAGERWPIGRARFEATYDSIPPTCMGKDGFYVKKPIPVSACQAGTVERIVLSGKGGVLEAKPGDWIVSDQSGHQWVVADAIFRQSYEAID